MEENLITEKKESMQDYDLERNDASKAEISAL